MRHAQRALLILVEQMFFEGVDLTDQQRGDIDALASGEAKEVMRVFVRAAFGDEEIDAGERRRLLSIAQRLRLPEDGVPEVSFDRAA